MSRPSMKGPRVCSLLTTHSALLSVHPARLGAEMAARMPAGHRTAARAHSPRVAALDVQPIRDVVTRHYRRRLTCQSGTHHMNVASFER